MSTRQHDNCRRELCSSQHHRINRFSRHTDEETRARNTARRRTPQSMAPRHGNLRHLNHGRQYGPLRKQCQRVCVRRIKHHRCSRMRVLHSFQHASAGPRRRHQILRRMGHRTASTRHKRHRLRREIRMGWSSLRQLLVQSAHLPPRQGRNTPQLPAKSARRKASATGDT